MPEKRILQPGESLFVQGGSPAGFFMLHQGALEILQASGDYAGLNDDIIIDKSRRVGLLDKKTMLVGFSANLNSPYGQSIRAVSKSMVVEYPLNRFGFKGIASKDFSGTVQILRQLYGTFFQSKNSLKKYASVLEKLNRFNDNMLLLYNRVGAGSAALDRLSEALSETFLKNDGTLDSQIPVEILIKDFSKYLDKDYSFHGAAEELMPKYDELVRNVLKSDVRVLAQMIQGNPSISTSVFEEYTKEINRIFLKIYDIRGEIDKKLLELFQGQDSWASYFVTPGIVDQWLLSPGIDGDFFSGLSQLLRKIEYMYKSLSREDFSQVGQYGDFLKAISKRPAEINGNEAGRVEEVLDSGQVPGRTSSGLKKSLHQIFEFSMIDNEFQNRMLKLLNDFKNLEDPFSADGEARKVRRFINQMYWQLYKQVFVRSKRESSVPKAVKLMLSYGFLDDELLSEEQLGELNELAAMVESCDCESVIDEYDFLTKVYEGEEEPSITEMGLNYDEFIREQNKYKKKGEVILLDEEDGPMVQKTLHEIDQRLASTAAVCSSGGTSMAFPILSSELVKGSLLQFHVSKTQLCEIIKKISDIDFSLFYRETVLKIDDAREIISEEIVPWFIMLPIYGSKTFLWQENVGNNKRSRGRIVVPAFFMGDLEKDLLHSFACFRWELNRTVKGAMWADPIEGGLSGEYFDFVNTYKKNSRLSPEAKEKIAIRFKSLRTNRDRFADDYISWILYEREGIMKLNSVVREMFYKHIPFNKEIRARLENMPAFHKFANRYTNVKNRDIAAYERRYKKYQDAEGNYPMAIEKFFDFLKK